MENTSAAIVTCVEAGILEDQTCRMIQSLRNWGGNLARMPVVAVTPRAGLAISKKTRETYDSLGVTYVRTGRSESRYGWYNFMNKPAAVLAAETACAADTLIWLDADILIVGEPTGLLLKPGDDFSACPTEKNVATEGPGDQYFPYWEAMCAALGMKLDDVPIVTEFRTARPIRSYFNGGVFSYRRGSGYARKYWDATEKLLNARIKLPGDGIFYHEQAAVGLTAALHHLNQRIMPEAFNYHFGSSTTHFVEPEKFRSAKVLHYHRSMQADRWEKFVGQFSDDYPAVKAWLEPMGPLADHQPRWKRAAGKLLRNYRKRTANRYLETCRVV